MGNFELMGWLKRLDERNGRALKKHNELFGGDDWVERTEKDMPRVTRILSPTYDDRRLSSRVMSYAFGFFVVGIVIVGVVRWVL